MKRSSIRQFYRCYFSATQGACWLARQFAGGRFEMLEELMQWEVTQPALDH